MSKKNKSLTLGDLADQGLQLTKHEATRLLPHISKISQHGASGPNEVEFEDDIERPFARGIATERPTSPRMITGIPVRCKTTTRMAISRTTFRTRRMS